MKHMQKAILITIACLSLGAAHAQITKPGVTFGFSGIYSSPQGSFKDAYKFGLGGEAFGGVGLGNTYIIATVGYKAFKEEVSIDAGTLTYVPVKVGLKQMFLLKRIFLQGDLGIASVKYDGYNGNSFTAGAGAGVRLAGLELGLYYDAFKIKNPSKHYSSLNFKAGYSFSL